MRRVLWIGAAAVLSLAMATTVQAEPGGGSHGHGSHGHGRHGHGRQGRGGHRHRWSHRIFDQRYGCNVFLCADDGYWYYWCDPDSCYYRLDYCPYGTYAWDDEG
jgi:hypothetical protein